MQNSNDMILESVESEVVKKPKKIHDLDPIA